MAQNNARHSNAMYYNTSANAYQYIEPAEAPSVQVREGSRKAAAAMPRLKPRAVFKACAVVVLAVAVATMLIVRYEHMAEASIRINSLRSEIDTISSEIELLNIKLAEAMDINTAQEIARDRLGMDYPEAGQIVRTEAGGSAVSQVTGEATPSYAAVPVSSDN